MFELLPKAGYLPWPRTNDEKKWNIWSVFYSISLTVKAGTRNETLDISGVSQFIKNLSLKVIIILFWINTDLKKKKKNHFIKKFDLNYFFLKGTTSRTREQVEKEIGNLGGNYSVDVSRETTSFTLTVLPEHVSRAVELLSDIVLNPLLNANQIEAEKPELYKNAVENHRDQMDVTLESAHFTVSNKNGKREN